MYVGIRTFPDITVKSSITALNMYSDWASKSHIHMTMQFRTSVLEFCTFIIIAFSFLHFWDISLLILLNVNVLILLLVTIPLIFFSLWQCLSSVQFSHSVMSNYATPWTAACQASLSITKSWNLLKLMTIESVMPSKGLILCRPLLLLPSVFPSIRVFSTESVLCIRWPKYLSFSFSISPSNEYSGLISLG